MMQKPLRNAYMIMAHGKWNQLKILMQLLDDENNDFYIHIDKKSKMPNTMKINDFVEKSNVYFVDSLNIKWGGYGTIDASMELLRCAVKREYDYYHLVSGVDLPLKSNDDINCFLKSHMYDNKSKVRITNYLSCGKVSNNIIRARVSHYNFFVDHFRTKPQWIGAILKKINALGYHVQNILKIDRLKKTGLVIYKGSLWYIISHDCANYFLDSEEKGKKLFGNKTFSGDEYVLQTLFMNSEYRNTIFVPKNKLMNTNLYEIDWENTKGDGSPHTFTMADMARLDVSANLFARKFDADLDSDIIEHVAKRISQCA